MTKRPVTIYGCSTDQQNECDYKYLARVWFFRTITIVVVSAVSVGGGLLWKTAEWKKQQEITTELLKSENVLLSNRMSKYEAIKYDIDTLKTWTRPRSR